MSRWPVLQKRREDDDWETVGYVRAPDREMALGFALHAFFRHGEGVDCAVADGEEVVPVADRRDVTGSTDKSYRVSAGYPLGPKRRRAEQRIADLGVRVDGARPGDQVRAAGSPPGADQ